MSNTSGNCGLDTDRLRVKFRLSRWSRHSCWESRVGMWTVSTRRACFSFESYCTTDWVTWATFFIFFAHSYRDYQSQTKIWASVAALRFSFYWGLSPWLGHGCLLLVSLHGLPDFDIWISGWGTIWPATLLKWPQYGVWNWPGIYMVGQATLPPFQTSAHPYPPPPTTCDFSWFNFICLQSTTVWKYWVESSRNKQKIMP